MKPTQTQQILEALQAGQQLTALDALNKFGCFRLAARIAELRTAGYKVTREQRKLDNGKHVAVYSLASTLPQ
jgi:hypothetical protein